MTILERLTKHTLHKKEFLDKLGIAIEEYSCANISITQIAKNHGLNYGMLCRVITQMTPPNPSDKNQYITLESKLNNEDVTSQ